MKTIRPAPVSLRLGALLSLKTKMGARVRRNYLFCHLMRDFWRSLGPLLGKPRLFRPRNCPGHVEASLVNLVHADGRRDEDLGVHPTLLIKKPSSSIQCV